MIRQEGLRRSGSGSARSASMIPLWPVSFGEVRLLNDIERYQFIGGLHMQVFSLLWGIVAIIGMLIGFVPLLGALNWLNIPFAGVGIILAPWPSASAGAPSEWVWQLSFAARLPSSSASSGWCWEAASFEADATAGGRG